MSDNDQPFSFTGLRILDGFVSIGPSRSRSVDPKVRPRPRTKAATPGGCFVERDLANLSSVDNRTL
jgi:hypothetical protein